MKARSRGGCGKTYKSRGSTGAGKRLKKLDKSMIIHESKWSGKKILKKWLRKLRAETG
jgi:hypothetical protein